MSFEQRDLPLLDTIILVLLICIGIVLILILSSPKPVKNSRPLHCEETKVLDKIIEHAPEIAVVAETLCDIADIVD